MSAPDLSKLADPFPAEDVEWRIGRAGKNAKGIWAMCLCYMTSRAVMNRLDEVCGPGNWQNEFRHGPDGAVLCGLSIRIGDEWVTKWDGASNTDIEAVKGGLSGAMKRAAVHWGIGRYLYRLDETFANVTPRGRFYGRLPQKQGGDPFRWDPPALPAWALPKGDQSAPRGEHHGDYEPAVDPDDEWHTAIDNAESIDALRDLHAQMDGPTQARLKARLAARKKALT